MIQKHLELIAEALSIPLNRVKNTAELLEEGATIPFISRYRKEVTGSLDEVQVADIKKQMDRLEEVEKRRTSILSSIEEQGKLTDDLRGRIMATYSLTELEDLYLPYKRKKKTRASVAREKGLEPLALRIYMQKDSDDVVDLANEYITDEVPTTDDALQGARDIIAEIISEHEVVRNKTRYYFEKTGFIIAKLVKSKEDEAAKYKDYFKFEEALKTIPSHRLLAIRRGEEEGFLRVSIEPNEEDIMYALEKEVVLGYGDASAQVKEALTDCYERLLSPSIETEFRNISKDKADAEAIKVFADNLRQLLLQAPVGQKRVLALDPGFRTGCNVVCLDESGNLIHNTTIYPHPPQNDEAGSLYKIRDLVAKYEIDAIAIGNGTAGRETMDLMKNLNANRNISLYMVNESGASIYSASDVAREEFPDHDITVRGSVSIGRRLADPLAELVKIDAKSIGVGQYQHDVNQSQLKDSLDRVVESCVNSVGINVNTASKHLLMYVSGLGPTLAQNIVTYRAENGQFTSRSQIKKVPRMGEKAFEQCAGFLRVKSGKNPLDNTAVHPERYDLVETMAKDLGCDVKELIKNPLKRKDISLKNYVNEKVGLPTLQDIIKELEKPGLDPRGEAAPFEFGDVRKMEDLHEGMILPGIVTNITKFGAFVDIGVKQDGLVHISQMANRFIKDPNEVVKLTQQVTVKVTEIDIPRNRIFLSMKEV
jgi:protein Tex